MMDQAQQDRAAWNSLPAETRQRMSFLDPEDFTVTGGTEAGMSDWERATQTLDRAEQYRRM
jgi:hypothetical protein